MISSKCNRLHISGIYNASSRDWQLFGFKGKKLANSSNFPIGISHLVYVCHSCSVSFSHFLSVCVCIRFKHLLNENCSCMFVSLSHISWLLLDAIYHHTNDCACDRLWCIFVLWMGLDALYRTNVFVWVRVFECVSEFLSTFFFLFVHMSMCACFRTSVWMCFVYW